MATSCPVCKKKRAYCFFDYHYLGGDMRLPSVDAMEYGLDYSKRTTIQKRWKQ